MQSRKAAWHLSQNGPRPSAQTQVCFSTHPTLWHAGIVTCTPLRSVTSNNATACRCPTHPANHFLTNGTETSSRTARSAYAETLEGPRLATPHHPHWKVATRTPKDGYRHSVGDESIGRRACSINMSSVAKETQDPGERLDAVLPAAEGDHVMDGDVGAQRSKHNL